MDTTPHADQAGPMPPRRSIPSDTFAARLTLARLHAGHRLSIREAAERCGLNYGTWTGWERGLEPRGLLDVVDRISAVLGVDRDWLLFGGPLSQSEENRGRWVRRDQNDAAEAAAPAGHNLYYPPPARKAPASYPLHRRHPVGRGDVNPTLAAAA